MARPSKFGTLNIGQVEELARRGWTDEEMAAFFGVDRSTWYRWKERHGEFRDALKSWKEEADARVERSLFERATGYAHPEDKIFNNSGEPMVVPTIKCYPPDTTAAIFWLKNRRPEQWRDKPNENADTDAESTATRIRDALKQIDGLTHGSDAALDEA